jgi:hypothetical protein
VAPLILEPYPGCHWPQLLQHLRLQRLQFLDPPMPARVCALPRPQSQLTRTHHHNSSQKHPHLPDQRRQEMHGMKDPEQSCKWSIGGVGGGQCEELCEKRDDK